MDLLDGSTIEGDKDLNSPRELSPEAEKELALVEKKLPQLHLRTQEHPDAITPQGPRSTRTPSHRKDPGAPGRHHTTRTQEQPDAITPQGPRSTRTPSHHKDPGAPGRHHTTRTQEHPDTFTTQATRWDPGTPDTIRQGGPRCNQTILDQENPEVPQTSLDQEIPETPIIL
ncbi:hypothetical protein STEG23_021942 [Scotinomys teguina]